MNVPLLLCSIFTASALSIFSVANAYELDSEGVPIPEEMNFEFVKRQSPFNLSTILTGSDRETALSTGVAMALKDWDDRICKPHYFNDGCRTGGHRFEISEPTIEPTSTHDYLGTVTNYHTWTLEFEYTKYTFGSQVTSTASMDGWFRAFYVCPSILRAAVKFSHYTADGGLEYVGPPWCAVPYNTGFCPAGYVYDQYATTNKCIMQCASGSNWNATLRRCEQEPVEETCKTQSNNPIDFISGRKYRAEEVITVGGRNPFSLVYFYDSKNGSVGTATGTITRYIDSSRSIDDSVAELPMQTYQEDYNDQGLFAADPTVLQGQYYGYMHDKWRHNFDDVLQIRGGTYILHTADGKQLSFESYGFHKSYSRIKFGVLPSGKEDFAGYEVLNNQDNTSKRFDESGRLRKIVRGDDDILTLTYEGSSLRSIHNSEGARIEFTEYSPLLVNSYYSFTESLKDYPTKVSTSDGRHVAIEWGTADKTKTRTSYLISKISRPYIDEAKASREFSYEAYARLLQDIHDVNEITNQRNLYAHFEYDGYRRAVVSELSGGYERVEVDYSSEDERIVTNALGLATNYKFADFDGVRRLQSVSGAETSNCAPTNTTYTYYPNGTIESQVTNGVITHFTYNSRNLIEVKTEAAGTTDEKITKTCWHDTFVKPERIIEAKRVTKFQYHSDGKVKATAIEARTPNNENCLTDGF